MKKLLSAVVTGCAICMVSLASAETAHSVQLSGDVSMKYERDTMDGERDLSGTISTFRLMAEKDLGAGWSLYSRFAAQYATEPGLADYTADGTVYPADRKSVGSIDLFGLNYKNGSMVYKIGRQELALGTTALLYSRPDSNIGKHAFVDGVTASGKIGILDVQAVIAREDNSGSDDNSLYAVRTGYSPNEDFNYGITLGRYIYKHKTTTDDSGNIIDHIDTNHIAIDSTYKIGKSTLTAELAKSNANTANKAFAATWNYGFDDKTSVYITGFRVENHADMGQQSDFDNDNQGLYYGVSHQLNKSNSLEFVYKQQKTISENKKNTKFEATISHSF